MDDFWQLHDVFTNGYQLVILGIPSDEDLPEEQQHNCDQMGCGNLSHVLARIPIMQHVPELAWLKEPEAAPATAASELKPVGVGTWLPQSSWWMCGCGIRISAHHPEHVTECPKCGWKRPMIPETQP